MGNGDMFNLKIEGLQTLDKIKKFMASQKASKSLGEMSEE